MSEATDTGDDVKIGQIIAPKEMETGQFRSKFTEELAVPTSAQAELRRVEAIPEGGGERLMCILPEFNRFP